MASENHVGGAASTDGGGSARAVMARIITLRVALVIAKAPVPKCLRCPSRPWRIFRSASIAENRSANLPWRSSRKSVVHMLRARKSLSMSVIASLKHHIIFEILFFCPTPFMPAVGETPFGNSRSNVSKASADGAPAPARSSARFSLYADAA